MCFYIFYNKKEGWQVEIQENDDFWFFRKTTDFKNWHSASVMGEWRTSWEHKLMFEPLSEEFLIDNIDSIIDFWFLANKKIPKEVKNRIISLKEVMD